MRRYKVPNLTLENSLEEILSEDDPEFIAYIEFAKELSKIEEEENK